MKPLKIFISSVQKEFESERKALAQYIRNDALLGSFFEVFLTGDIERFGTGILEMIKLSKEADLIAPEFVINEGFKVILWRPFATTKAIHDTAHDTAHDAAHDKKYIEISFSPSRLLLIMQGEMSRTDMMQKLELTHRTNFKENYLDIALEMNWIEMTIPEKKTSKNQKYRLTQLGIQERKKIKRND